MGGLPNKRSPRALFIALSELKLENAIQNLLHFDFYGFANQDTIRLCNQNGLDCIVSFNGHIPRLQGIEQLLTADVGLVIIPESEGSKTAVPGKLYEYIGAGVFILGLCPPDSVVARLISEYGHGIAVSIDNVVAIKSALSIILTKFVNDQLNKLSDIRQLSQYERSCQRGTLAKILRETVVEA